MKYLLVFILFDSITSIFANDVCEDKSVDFEHWQCKKNKDLTVDVTYDCLHANTPVEIWIWSDKLPNDLHVLTIQNCGNLTLNLLKTEQRSVGEFRFLNVVNVSELTIVPEFCSQCSRFRERCVPPNVEFKNITMYNLDYSISEDSFCGKQGTTLKSLLLKNVSIDTINNYAVRSKDLRQLVMDGVKIKESKASALYVENKKGTIVITNSEIEVINGKFIECNVFEVMMANNSVQHFNEPFDKNDKNFIFEADKITLSGNKMKVISDNTFKFISSNVQITDNVFQRVDEKAFHNIIPTKPATNSSLVFSNTFNFSNNTIYFLSPGALMIPLQNASRNALFTNITIFNNKVNCICDNLFWFESVARDKDNIRNYFNYKWAKGSNQNKCLNMPNCDVSQVLKNFHELCEQPYRCPEMIISEGKEKVLNFINYNNEMGRETSKLLEVLIDQIGENKMFKDSDDESRQRLLQSLLKKTLIEEEQKWINVLNLNEISSCLLIITCLLCGVIFYFLVSKFLASSFLQTLTSRYGRRSYLCETEMNPSCSAEFN